MAGDPIWRMGAMRYALTLAGYWTMRLPDPTLLSLLDSQRCSFAPDEVVSVRQPTIVTRGKIHVIEEAVGRRWPRLGTFERGALLIPIVQQSTDRGVRLIAAGAGEGLVVSQEQLLEAGARDATVQRALLEGLTAAVEAQFWALRLGAHAEPLSRLAGLLLRIAEDCGVDGSGELLLAGAPDAREMSVLAGVSRESVVINLAWLEEQSVLRRAEGRLWVTDIGALRHEARLKSCRKADISL
ncbi:MAG: hypothetical protein H0V86_07550 [Chloroflexia bacterium]|nr:hypothetical protein [Chloroflexia bacterium]